MITESSTNNLLITVIAGTKEKKCFKEVTKFIPTKIALPMHSRHLNLHCAILLKCGPLKLSLFHDLDQSPNMLFHVNPSIVWYSCLMVIFILVRNWTGMIC